MDRITQGYIDAFATSFGINDKNNTTKVFEMFAAYSAIAHEYNDSFSIENVVVGDSGDCGIDGIAIIVNGTVIDTIEEFDDILDEYHTISEVKFILIQAKTSSNFDSSVMSNIFLAAGLANISSPDVLKAKTPSLKCNRIASSLFFSLEISLKLFLICPIIRLNDSTNLITSYSDF